MRRPRSRQNASVALSGSERGALRLEFAQLERLEAHFERTLAKVQEMNQAFDAEKAHMEEAKASIIATEGKKPKRELALAERERAVALLSESQEVIEKHTEAGQRYVRRLERFRWNMASMFGFCLPTEARRRAPLAAAAAGLGPAAART